MNRINVAQIDFDEVINSFFKYLFKYFLSVLNSFFESVRESLSMWVISVVYSDDDGNVCPRAYI
jgi:hypothetical protein